MAQEFHEAGVYYYSDFNYQATAEYAGCIIVKPAVTEHQIQLTSEGFEPGKLRDIVKRGL